MERPRPDLPSIYVTPPERRYQNVPASWEPEPYLTPRGMGTAKAVQTEGNGDTLSNFSGRLSSNPDTPSRCSTYLPKSKFSKPIPEKKRTTDRDKEMKTPLLRGYYRPKLVRPRVSRRPRLTSIPEDYEYARLPTTSGDVSTPETDNQSEEEEVSTTSKKKE